MINTMNPDVVMTVIANVLKADVTLREHLGDANRVFLWRFPNEQPSKYILLTLYPFDPNDMGIRSGELRVYVYTKLLSNGMIDSSGNVIVSRCEELLNNVSPPSLAGGCILNVMTLGTIPSLHDLQDKSHAKGVLRLRIEAGLNG